MKTQKDCLGEGAFHEKNSAKPHGKVALIMWALAFLIVIKNSGSGKERVFHVPV